MTKRIGGGLAFLFYARDSKLVLKEGEESKRRGDSAWLGTPLGWVRGKAEDLQSRWMETLES
jgi:hypothetical protein